MVSIWGLIVSQMIVRTAVTIASVRAHGVQKLLVYCLGTREGDWPCNHRNTLPVDRFQADEALRDIEQRCRCTMCGWREIKDAVV